MARIECEAEEVELVDERGDDVPGVAVTCGECDHRVESFGTSGRSIRRCLALLREECPRGEANFYACDDDGWDD